MWEKAHCANKPYIFDYYLDSLCSARSHSWTKLVCYIELRWFRKTSLPFSFFCNICSSFCWKFEFIPSNSFGCRFFVFTLFFSSSTVSYFTVNDTYDTHKHTHSARKVCKHAHPWNGNTILFSPVVRFLFRLCGISYISFYKMLEFLWEMKKKKTFWKLYRKL